MVIRNHWWQVTKIHKLSNQSADQNQAGLILRMSGRPLIEWLVHWTSPRHCYGKLRLLLWDCRCSLLIRSWTLWKSETWQGIMIVPFCSNPYSSSAFLRSSWNKGWFICAAGITKRCRSSSLPTYTATQPLGTSLRKSCASSSELPCPSSWWWWWGGKCKWKWGKCSDEGIFKWGTWMCCSLLPWSDRLTLSPMSSTPPQWFVTLSLSVSERLRVNRN